MKRYFGFLALAFVVGCQKVEVVPEIVVEGVEVSEVGGVCSFGYELLNPQEGGALSVEIPQGNEWLSEAVVDQSARKVSMRVEENLVKEERSETVTLKYAYGDRSVTATAIITQSASQYDYVVDCTEGVSIYCESDALQQERLFKYRLVLADSYVLFPEAGSSCYTLDLIASKLTKDKLPKAGTYNMTNDAEIEDLTVTDLGANVVFYGEDVTDFSDCTRLALTDATVEVKKNDDGVYTIQAQLTDSEGKQHLVRYSGELELDEITIHSTLRADLELDLSDYIIQATNEGDYHDADHNNWMVRIFTPEMNSNDVFVAFDVLTSTEVDSEFTTTMVFEPYSEKNPGEETCYLPGEGGMRHSWMMTIDVYDPVSGQISVKSPSAPFCDGVLTIEPAENGRVDISGKFSDDAGYEITLHGENMPITYQ